jgi:hypothetical protein
MQGLEILTLNSHSAVLNFLSRIIAGRAVRHFGTTHPEAGDAAEGLAGTGVPVPP